MKSLSLNIMERDLEYNLHQIAKELIEKNPIVFFRWVWNFYNFTILVKPLELFTHQYGCQENNNSLRLPRTM